MKCISLLSITVLFTNLHEVHHAISETYPAQTICGFIAAANHGLDQQFALGRRCYPSRAPYPRQ